MTASRAPVVLLLAALWAAWVIGHAFTLPATPLAPLLDHPLDAVPYWREALWRAARGLAGATVVLLAGWQLGRRALRRVAFDDPLESLLFNLAVGLLALQAVLFLLARAGAYRAGPVAALVVIAAVSRPAALIREARTLRRRSGVAAKAVARRGEWVFAAIVMVALAYSATAAFAPETEYDALWYHLWLPHEWLAHGTFTDPPGEYIGLYPGGWELLNGAAMVIGGPVAARLLHFACLPLTALAACSVARWCAPDVSRPLLAALVVTPPTLMWEASTAYVDLALAWMTTLVVIAVGRHAAGTGRHWLWLATVAAGGALGIKHLGLVVLAIAACVLCSVELRRRAAGAAFGASALFVAGALALALPWYARAYAASGNPVFPELYGLFGAEPATRWSPGGRRTRRRHSTGSPNTSGAGGRQGRCSCCRGTWPCTRRRSAAPSVRCC